MPTLYILSIGLFVACIVFGISGYYAYRCLVIHDAFLLVKKVFGTDARRDSDICAALHQAGIKLSNHEFTWFLRKLIETDRVHIDVSEPREYVVFSSGEKWYRLGERRARAKRMYDHNTT
ncbi:MAG: hypothetical protein AAB381_00375 [Patescibacteria group bacterium]